MPLRTQYALLVASVAGMLPVRAVAACPDCAPVRAARAAIHDDPAFWSYLLWTALPFVFMALVAAAAHRAGRPAATETPP